MPAPFVAADPHLRAWIAFALQSLANSMPTLILPPAHTLADRAGADIIHLCWERAGPRPQDLITSDLIATAQRAKRQIVLWHEERREIISEIVQLPVLGICSDRPELLRTVAL